MYKPFIISLLLTIFLINFSFAQEKPPAPLNPAKFVEESSNLKKINNIIEKFLFFDISFGTITQTDENGHIIYQQNNEGQKVAKTTSIPFLIALLAIASIYLTIYFRFINVKLFKHSINVIRGKFDDPNSKGELSHFKALTSALSGTIGLGNIAGVAIAISQGGPGALLWMVFLAFFGMTCKFLSTTLALSYRHTFNNKNSGGPMYYLKYGLEQIGLKKLGLGLGFLYALCIIGAAFGAGNMFQTHEVFSILDSTFSLGNSQSAQYTFSIIFAILVGLVIIGGVKRLGTFTSKIVPTMCGIYLIASVIVIISNFSSIPRVFSLIFDSAFNSNAAWGGLVGVLVVGFQRAAFSSEVGLGSASIVHANAKTDEPIREGIVAMIGPVIDIMIVCTATALVIITTGAYKNTNKGIQMTSEAFETVIPNFSYVLTICAFLFAYSTCITWFHYAQKGWFYILRELKLNTSNKFFDISFKIFYLSACIIGVTNTFDDVLVFTDLILLSLAFPNLIGGIILAKKVKEQAQIYMKKYKAAEFKIYK